MIPVSICLVTYNRASVLPKTLDSLLAQTFGDFELIISDDCSSDHTEEVCRHYERKDKRVRYFRNATNLNMPGNLNAAIQRARGVYIANLHDEDIYRPDLIEKWKEALDAVPDAPFVFNAYDTILKDGSHRLYQMPFDLRVPGTEIALHYFRTLTSCVWGTVMARSSAYARAGLFDPSFGFISDVDMWLRLARDSDPAYVKEPLITITPRGKDHPYRYVHWRHVFWSLGIYTKHLPNYRHRLPQAIAYYQAAYPRTLRRYCIISMLSLIKNRRWERVREGLSIWRDADDKVLRRIGLLFGQQRWQPGWYDKSWWAMTRLS